MAMHSVKGQSVNSMDMPARMMPSFHLTDKDYPGIKNWQVGKKYTVTMQIEQTSMMKDEYSKGMSAGFKIHKIGEGETMSEDEKKGRMGHY